jgi:hypothetical protein
LGDILRHKHRTYLQLYIIGEVGFGQFGLLGCPSPNQEMSRSAKSPKTGTVYITASAMSSCLERGREGTYPTGLDAVLSPHSRSSGIRTGQSPPGSKGFVSLAWPIVQSRLTTFPLLRILSRILFHWLRPFLDVGYSRPLEKEGACILTPMCLTDTGNRPLGIAQESTNIEYHRPA